MKSEMITWGRMNGKQNDQKKNNKTNSTTFIRLVSLKNMIQIKNSITY